MKLKIHSNKDSSTFYTKNEKQLINILTELGLMKHNWLRPSKNGQYFTIKPKITLGHKRYIESVFVCEKQEKEPIINSFTGCLVTGFGLKMYKR